MHSEMRNNIDILYDHYKDSFLQIKNIEKKREQLFLFLLIFSVLVTLQIGEPHLVEKVSQKVIQKKLGAEVVFNLSTIFSGIQFIWLWVMMMYYQKNIFIERQYGYLHTIENKLSNTKLLQIEREGKQYLLEYPWFLWVVHRVYTIIVPISIIFIAISKWWLDLNKQAYFINKGYFVFDTLILLLVVVITLLYMVWIHFKDFKSSTD